MEVDTHPVVSSEQIIHPMQVSGTSKAPCSLQQNKVKLDKSLARPPGTEPRRRPRGDLPAVTRPNDRQDLLLVTVLRSRRAQHTRNRCNLNVTLSRCRWWRTPRLRPAVGCSAFTLRVPPPGHSRGGGTFWARQEDADFYPAATRLLSILGTSRGQRVTVQPSRPLSRPVNRE